MSDLVGNPEDRFSHNEAHFVQVMFTYEKHPNDNGSTMRFELRDDGDINVDEVAASTMWSILLPILLEFEELLQAYSGNLLIKWLCWVLIHKPIYITIFVHF